MGPAAKTAIIVLGVPVAAGGVYAALNALGGKAGAFLGAAGGLVVGWGLTYWMVKS